MAGATNWTEKKQPKKGGCKHQNGYLIEVMYATHTRAIQNGVVADLGVNEIGDISHYEYQCKSCKGVWSSGTLDSTISKIPSEFHFLCEAYK